jgi:hypothetical protein
MGILEYFDDWQKHTGIVEVATETKGSAGKTVTTWSQVQTEVPFASWVGTSRQTSENDKFVDQETGDILLDPADISFTPTISHRVTDENGKIYYIEGVDNIAGFDELYKLFYRVEHGG